MTHQQFCEQYLHISDDELLQVAGGGDDYRPEAVDAAKSELLLRGIALTGDLIQGAVSKRKSGRERLEAELVAGSGLFGVFRPLIAGRFREAREQLTAFLDQIESQAPIIE